MADTDLVLTGIGVTPYSARGLVERVTLLGAGALRRDVNGTLVDVTDPAHRKFALAISGDDQEPPALDGIWPGHAVTVDALTELAYPTAGGSPSRTVVPGSQRTNGAFTVYRPRLNCLVVDWTIDRDEWGAAVGWRLELEEV